MSSIKVKPGQYVKVDAMGRIVRVSNTITSWAARTYKMEANGRFTRIA